MNKEWTAKWIGMQDEDQFNPVFFKDFQVDFPIWKATFYITARGVFEAFINGSRINNEYLPPYRTGEDGSLQYFAYDVTDLLYAGPDSASNSIDIFLGKGWDEQNDMPIALRAEIILEPSGEDAGEALAMEWDDLEGNVDEFEDLLDSSEFEDILNETSPDDLLADDTDALLDELLRDEDGDFPEVNEEILNGATGIIAKNGIYYEAKHEQKKQTSVIRDPQMETAEKLLEDEEPEMEFFSTDDQGTMPATFLDLQTPQEEAEEIVQNEVTGHSYEMEPFINDDVMSSANAYFAEEPKETKLFPDTPQADGEPSFGDFPTEDMAPDTMADDAIQAILAEQERQLASFVPNYVDEEKQLEEVLADAVDDSFFLDGVPNDVDDLANAIAAEISGDFSELTPEERAWYDDIDGQVSFDFAGQTDSSPEEYEFTEDDLPEDDLDVFLEESVISNAPDEAFDDEDLFSTEDLPDMDLTDEAPEEELNFEGPVQDYEVDTLTEADDAVVSEEADDEAIGEVTEEPDELATEETLEEAEETVVVEKEPAEAELVDGEPTEVEPAENELTDNVSADDDVPSEGSAEDELAFKVAAASAAPAVAAPKGLFQKIRAFDLSKKIGLTIGDAEEEATERTMEEQIIVIGTDETWGYYASDIEDNRIDGFEIFDRTRWIGKENPDKEAVVMDMDIPLVESCSEPMLMLEELQPQSITETENGDAFILDFGQIFTGFVSFQSELPEGAKVVLSFSEDGAMFSDDSNAFVYVSDGIPETASPHFALFTGRFVRLSGWEEQPDAAAFTAYVIGTVKQEETAAEEPETTDAVEEPVLEDTVMAAAGILPAAGLVNEILPEETEADEVIEDMADEEETDTATEEAGEITEEAMEPEYAVEPAGFVETSDAYLNQMASENITTMQHYLAVVRKLSEGSADEKIPTDEFCAGIRTACYTLDAKDLLMQYFRELREEQLTNDKAIPAYIPADQDASKCFVHGGEAVKAIYTLYEMYGETKILEDNFDLIKDAISYVSKEDTEERYLVPCKGIRGEETEGSFITTAYYYEAVVTAAKVAEILGREEKARYEELAEKIREAFLEEYFTRSGRFAEDTQTAYVLALRAGLCDDKEKLTEEFKKRLRKDCYQIKCGPVGLRDLCMVLANLGEMELAYRFLMDVQVPDGLKQEKAAEFLFSYVNGIRPQTPGFENILIRPLPDSRLIYSTCDHHLSNGMVRSDWEVTENGKLRVHFEIPDDAEAKILMPDCAGASLREQILPGGAYDFTYLPTRDYLHLFHENSLAGDILKYEESLAILEEEAPEIAARLTEYDPEMMARTLDELIPDENQKDAVKTRLFEL